MAATTISSICRSAWAPFQETEVMQTRKTHVNRQHHRQSKLIHGHCPCEPLHGYRLFHQLLEIQLSPASSPLATGRHKLSDSKPRSHMSSKPPILFGFANTRSSPCLASSLTLCSFVLFTVWVTPWNQLAELGAPRLFCFTARIIGGLRRRLCRWKASAQFPCIRRLTQSSVTGGRVAFCQ